MSWGGDLIGSFDAGGNTVIHNVVSTPTLTYTSASNFDLGGDAWGLAVETRAALMMIGDITCGDLILTSGSLDLGDNTLAASDITQVDGVLTTTTDYGGTISLPVNDEYGIRTVVDDVVASKWINIIDGADGGGNRKLLFPPTHALTRTDMRQSGIILDSRPVLVPEPPNYIVGLGFDTEHSVNNPPDCQGAIGPDHIVQTINGNFSIYDKTDGSVLDTKSLDAFFIAGGTSPENTAFDPRIQYDPVEKRFYVISSDGSSGNSYSNLMIAVSSSSDPTDPWNSFRFGAQDLGPDPHTHWLDFPVLGYNNSVITAMGLLIDKTSPYVHYNMVYVFPKSDLLSATPNIDNACRVLPPDVILTYPKGKAYCPIIDPHGSMPHFIIGTEYVSGGYGSVVVSEVTEDGAGGYNIAITNTSYGADSFDGVLLSNRPGYGGGRQPGPVPPGWTREVWLHHGVGEDGAQGQSPVRIGNYIYGAYSTPVSGDCATVFFALNTISQEVEIATTIHYPGMDMIFNSVAVNDKGRVVINFTGTGPSIYPNSYCVVGRITSDQFPPFSKVGAIFSDPIQLTFGTQSHYFSWGDNRNRYGDYSATVIDPLNNNHFWMFQEYPGGEMPYNIRATQIILD
jgi:hypothetical protein